MNRIQILKNPILNYAWGSYTAISGLLGETTPSSTPQAELWMGAHPKAPSLMESNGVWIPLKEAISKNPEEILGRSVSKAFDQRLPFLFKVLAAEKPLSIQTHPDKIQAKKGFDRETRRHIPIDSPIRNYRDENHKPECLCAISPFWALCGFRKISEMIVLFEKSGLSSLKKEIADLKHRPDSKGMRDFLSHLLMMESLKRQKVIEEAITWAAPRVDDDPIARWTILLCREYPMDLGVIAPMYLNLISLSPGEALYLPAGMLHTYLKGTGIEVMANSDNVVRGGLTSKHVDVQELFEVIRFDEADVQILKAVPISGNESQFVTPAEEFALSVIVVNRHAPYLSAPNRSIEILFCTHGSGAIKTAGDNSEIQLQKGVSVVVPAAVCGYQVRGNLTLYKVRVPLSVEAKKA
ncbi:MAG: mannose-6-phosphate isomerase, class I [Pseudomonadota bacterium]